MLKKINFIFNITPQYLILIGEGMAVVLDIKLNIEFKY